MFKVCFLTRGSVDPFRLQGDFAKDAVTKLYPGISGYVQTRSLPDQEDASFSGVAELWFLSAEAAKQAGAAGINGLISDGAEIVSTVVGMERVVMRASNYMTLPRIKGVYPFRKRSDFTVEEFQSYWWHNHGPIAALTEEALSYTQLHPAGSVYETTTPDYDGITEISWPDLPAASRGLGSRQMSEDQGSDAPNFVDIDSVALFLAQEEIVIAP